MSRRSSLSNILVARRPSMGGATPNLATNSGGPDRRGSLKDLAAAREALHRATSEHEQTLDKHRRAVRALLQAHTVSELKKSVSKLIDIDGSMKPVDAFEVLLSNNIEAAPVYTLRRASDALSPGHARSSGFGLPPTSPISRRLPLTISPGPVLHRSISPAPGAPAGPTSASSFHGHSLALPASPRAMSPMPIVMPRHGSPGPMSALSPTSRAAAFFRERDSNAAAAAAAAGAAVAAGGQPSDATYKEYTGFLDIRDLVSSVILLKTQPVNEDELVFTALGPEIPAAPSSHGLDGLGVELQQPEELIPPPLAAMREEPSGSPPAASASGSAAVTSPLSGEESSTSITFSPVTPVDLPLSSDAAPAAAPAAVSLTVPVKDLALSEAEDDISAGSDSGARGRSRSPRKSDPDHLVPPRDLSPSAQQAANVSMEWGWAETVGAGIRRFLSPSTGNISVTYLSRRNPFRPVRPTSTLLDVAEQLARGAHRVPVVSPDGAIVDIISQSSLIAFLLEHADELAETFGTRVNDIDLGCRDVVTVSTDLTALDAFARMDEVRLSGLAIVDDDAKLVGSTSSRDMKRFALDKGKISLSMPVIEYLDAARSGSVAWRRSGSVKADETSSEAETASPEDASAVSTGAGAGVENDTSATTVPESSTVLDVLKALAERGTNRAFCIDEDNFPVRVVSLADIMRLAAGH